MYNKNAWHKYKNKKPVMDFANDYKKFLNVARTERLATEEVEKLLVKSGFKKMSSFKKIKAGDKVYSINKHKNVAAFVVGKKPIGEGLHILGSHIDSPRLDLKQNPLYEDTGLALFDTHYYGAIKKYQWVTTPLALIGVVCKTNGETVKVNIGLKDDDPVIGVTDLLIHLSDAQLEKPLKFAVRGEALDLSVGSIPLEGEDEEAVKKNILKIFKDKYGVDEHDFISAELEAVPAYPVKDYGLDRSMIAGYGQDDRSCAYPSLRALMDIDPKKLEYTSCVILTDKEETGSEGATGAKSFFIENVVADLVYLHDEHHPLLMARRAFAHSKMVSSDVTAAADPLFKYASAPNRNMARFGHGLCFNKYTGHCGKREANDANPEYIAYLRNILRENNIFYQASELGAVDEGGGGTISYVLAKYNMDVIDAGVPLLSMHSPMEIISKVDLYETYLFYKAFLLAKK